jgi:hypothetical protein
MLVIILVVILVLLLLGAVPRAGAYNESWGPWPGGLVGLVLVILLILLLLGRL